MVNTLYDRLYEVLEEIKIKDNDFSFTKWAELAEMGGGQFGIIRSKLKRGKDIRYKTLEHLAESIDRFPLLFKNKYTDEVIKLGDKFMLYKEQLPNNYIAQSFKLYRSLRNFKNKEVVEKSGVSYATYINVEKGLNTPRLSSLEDIASALRLSVIYFPEKKKKKEREKKEISDYERIPQELQVLGRKAIENPALANPKELDEALEFVQAVYMKAKGYLIRGKVSVDKYLREQRAIKREERLQRK